MAYGQFQKKIKTWIQTPAFWEVVVRGNSNPLETFAPRDFGM